jgi:hypothetical protein
MLTSLPTLALIACQFEIRRSNSFQHVHDTAADFAGFGMTTDLFLGEDQFAIYPDIKNAARAGDKFPAADKVLNFAFIQKLVRQTDGNRLVSSSGTILDDDVHSAFLHDFLLCLF